MSESKIGIVICNYNKKHFIIPCIESVLNSDMKGFDVYVVDNASTDGSVEAIRDNFSDKVTLIVNSENLGGSGGFNTGLIAALASPKHYEYLMCVDNDILMDNDNIRILFEFLEDCPEVGMAGSKICRMQRPERLQEMGAAIDFDKCAIVPYYKDMLDDDTLPEVQYCDYVPACSLMIRRSVIEAVGIMPQENFIYWDDMEWGYLVNRAGYKVVSLRAARVLHDMGTNSGTSYFPTYYFWRNRLHFFMKYTPDDKYENMMSVLLEDLFKTLYGCYYKGKANQISVMMHAFDDAVHDKRGKAAEDVILERDTVADRLSDLIYSRKKLVIGFDGNYKLLQDIILKAKAVCGDAGAIPIEIVCDNAEEMQNQHPECSISVACDVHDYVGRTDTLVLKMCEHVSKVEDKSLRIVHIDGYSNLLADERDVAHFESMDYAMKMFIESQKVLMRRGR